MLLSNTGDNPFIEGACTRRVKDSRDFLRSLNSAFTASEVGVAIAFVLKIHMKTFAAIEIENG
ncbi:unnamed protein product [Symbiodinium microadriaticum]|nr:unnamed protein product [Symbiodinium microadriaticum]CAE7925952.1 unnamed protein product [Symbiodinium sp. KB8]